jgi:hypothetical protein
MPATDNIAPSNSSCSFVANFITLFGRLCKVCRYYAQSPTRSQLWITTLVIATARDLPQNNATGDSVL